MDIHFSSSGPDERPVPGIHQKSCHMVAHKENCPCGIRFDPFFCSEPPTGLRPGGSDRNASIGSSYYNGRPYTANAVHLRPWRRAQHHHKRSRYLTRPYKVKTHGGYYHKQRVPTIYATHCDGGRNPYRVLVHERYY